MNFIKILKNILKENNVTQTEFAKRVGVKQSQVSEWLSGKSKPGYDNLRNIALAFGISADVLLRIQDL